MTDQIQNESIEDSEVVASSSALPRLVYVGDVPVEASYHGSVLLYRLLQTYPVELLSVLEVGEERSLPERRLDFVDYSYNPPPLAWLAKTRLSGLYKRWQTFIAGFRGRKIASSLRSVSPEAILSVSHGTGWIVAAKAAKLLDLPLHLICHDEWVRIFERSKLKLRNKERVFRNIYRGAASRLCVSPAMAASYEKRFGVTGDVLYPTRSIDAVSHRGPPNDAPKTDRALTFGYAGSIHSSGQAKTIQVLAERLAAVGGRIVVYGPLDEAAARRLNLTRANIEIAGLIPPNQIVETLRSRVDVLYAPMSFAEEARINMELCFPSKLTDYTLTGLPILIWGPNYCAAVQWAQKYPGVAEYVTSQDGQGLDAAIARFGDAATRLAAGRRAAAVGRELFSFEKGGEIFHSALRSVHAFTR